MTGTLLGSGDRPLVWIAQTEPAMGECHRKLLAVFKSSLVNLGVEFLVIGYLVYNVGYVVYNLAWVFRF